MKKILLCCAGGMSTSILANRMEKEAEMSFFESKIWAVSVSSLEKHIKEGVDVVLIGPQIRYMSNEVTKICQDYKIPSGVIPMKDYGTMNGKKVLDLALELMNLNSEIWDFFTTLY